MVDLHHKNYRWEMSELVVKDNALINASYNLDLTEQRLILLAIVEARESGKGINANDPLNIHAESYINQFGVHRNTAYQALKDACDDLFARQFSYQSLSEKGNIQHHKSRWVSEVIYVEQEAVVKLIFAPAIIPLITRLEKHFTSYELEQVSQLKSAYAVRLYEILIAWRSTGKTPVIGLDDFKKQIGINEGDYKRIDVLKSRVLEPSIKQINEHTDIIVSVAQHKTGRSVTGFSFRFKQKPQPKVEQRTDPKRDPNTPDFFVEMTDAQRHLFAHKLSELPEVGSEYAEIGESAEDFTKRLADMLLEPKKFRMFYPLLEQLGFSSKKNESTVKLVDQVKTYTIEDHKFIAFNPRGSVHLSSCAFNIARDKRYKHLKKDSEKMADFESRLKTMLLDEKQQSQFFGILRGETSRFKPN